MIRSRCDTAWSPAGRECASRRNSRGLSRCHADGEPQSPTSRSSHASWEPRPDRPDPIALPEEQAAERVPELVPIRYGRMSGSPFAFYRGAAYVMASDLAGSAHTGIRVRLCGDAHLGNFGAFALA